MKYSLIFLTTLFLTLNVTYVFAGKNKKKACECCCSCSSKVKKFFKGEKGQAEEMKDKMHDEFVEKLQKGLDLTKEQKAKVDEILKEGWEEMKEKKDKLKEDYQVMRDKTNEKIRELLDEKQKIKFGEILEKMKEKLVPEKLKKHD